MRFEAVFEGRDSNDWPEVTYIKWKEILWRIRKIMLPRLNRHWVFVMRGNPKETAIFFTKVFQTCHVISLELTDEILCNFVEDLVLSSSYPGQNLGRIQDFYEIWPLFSCFFRHFSVIFLLFSSISSDVAMEFSQNLVILWMISTRRHDKNLEP